VSGTLPWSLSWLRPRPCIGTDSASNTETVPVPYSVYCDVRGNSKDAKLPGRRAGWKPGDELERLGNGPRARKRGTILGWGKCRGSSGVVSARSPYTPPYFPEFAGSPAAFFPAYCNETGDS